MTWFKKSIVAIATMNKTKALKYTLSVLTVTLASALAAYATKLFLIPHEIPPGGFSGLSNILHILLLPYVNIPIGVIILILNVPMYLCAIKIIGNRFGVLSIIGTIAYSLAFDWLPMIDFYTDPMLAVLYGGAIVGVAFGVILRTGGSTGGSDMLAYVINYYKPGMSLGLILLSVDGLVVALAGILFGMEKALYAFLAMFLGSKIIDYILDGGKMSRAFYVISQRSHEIADGIFDKLKRGVTGLRGVGMYTKKEKDVLICIVLRSQSALLKQLIYSIDPQAFIFTTNVQEVYGEGFNQLKKIERKRREEQIAERKAAEAEVNASDGVILMPPAKTKQPRKLGKREQAE